MPLFRRATEVSVPSSLDGPWSVVEVTDDGSPLLARVNQGIAPLVGDRRYRMRGGIAVRLHEPDDRGFPVRPRDNDSLARIEDELAALFGSGRETLFALVITGAGVREFVFYTGDERRFRERFRAWALTPKSHPIQMMLVRDAGWHVYRRLAG